ncbi:30S ribosomal protein S27ae [Metallosphaera tengchongensis]|uniref:Small ribosomal subunit protein eS31 n=1 Tax=Metallosphaera tengchongensis TaxID=1532350 RepID=A0A6N0NVW3_9CREN|nr:30S ribosomal protein S27ae [Metallosphaera tengchongensis]QKQ99788.1 30S ribosomal protein S27ae [Metallosphaera tengchongensis]
MAKGEEKASARLYYDTSGEKIKLKNKKCPRCGSVMAHHMKPKERWACGKCGYTEFVVGKAKS